MDRVIKCAERIKKQQLHPLFLHENTKLSEFEKK